MNGTISVIVPVFQVEPYLDDCIGSIVNQTYEDLEIILVDDGSTDRCPEICDDWARTDERIRVLHKRNGGLSDARNAGLDLATGDYIAFVDSDDWIDLRMYEVMRAALEREEADLCSCNLVRHSAGSNMPWGHSEYTVGGSEEMLRLLYNDAQFPVSAWNKLYCKRLWDALRFPVGKICEDAFTTYKLVDRAERIVHLPEPFYHYRIREGSIMTEPFGPRRMDEEAAWRMNCEFVRAHYPKIYREARSFYLQKVAMLLGEIEKSEGARTQCSKEYNYLQTILRENRRFLMFDSSLDLKNKVKLLGRYLSRPFYKL